MKKRLMLLVCMAVCWQMAWCQDDVSAIRERYNSYKQYIATHQGENMNDGGEWGEYYHLECRQILPGTGGHIEDIYMYWDEKGVGDEDLIYPPHILTFATKKYNYAAREYYEEYLFDADGQLQFIYGYDPMCSPDELSREEEYEFRFYLKKGKLIKAVIKKRSDSNLPFKEVFSGTSIKGTYDGELNKYVNYAEKLQQLFSDIEKEAYIYSE